MSENKSENKSEQPKLKQITLTSKMYKFAIVMLVFGTLMFLCAGGYSIYSLMTYQNNRAEINEMQQSTEHQQEQLLNLSKKATELSEELQNLTQMETELRIQAGVKPPKDNETTTEEVVQTEESNPTEETNQNEETNHNGQGGPIEDLKLSDVEEALGMLETKLQLRRESLEELQSELKTQREQMAMMIQIQQASQAANAITMNGPMATNSSAFTPQLTGSTVPAIWPTTGVVTSPYGLRWGGSDFHPGIDIANDLGTPIVATADGVVEYAGWNSGGYGNMVDINHGNGMMTRYGHASQVLVTAGQQVARGQVIALMGSTGFSTGPHVHYEVHVNGQRVNPISYL